MTLNLEAIKAHIRKVPVWDEYHPDLHALLAEVERLRKVEAAALAFIPAHDQATFDMKPVYGCAFAHGVQFVGKGYGEELDALRAALDAAQGGG